VRAMETGRSYYFFEDSNWNLYPVTRCLDKKL
jgi:hypothetical protein